MFLKPKLFLKLLSPFLAHAFEKTQMKVLDSSDSRYFRNKDKTQGT